MPHAAQCLPIAFIATTVYEILWTELRMLSPIMEKNHILGDVDGRRRGDVSLPLWRANKGLAIDVAVTCPLASSYLNDPSHCETYAEVKKHAYYDEGFKGTRFEFAAMVFETTGGTNEEGLEVLRQLFRFAAKHQMFS